MTQVTASAVSYQGEKVSDVWDELLPLLERQAAEVEDFHDIPLKPDRDGYEQLEQLGVVRCFTVRDVSWKLIGYFALIVGPNPQHCQSIMARQEGLYVVPEERGDVGPSLIRFAESRLREIGVQAIYPHTKARDGLNFGAMLTREGYQIVEHIYAKRLDR